MVHPLEFFLSYLEGFPGVSAGKESACNAGDLGLIPGLGRSPGEGKGHPLQYSPQFCGLCSPWGRKDSDTTERLLPSLEIQRRGEGETVFKRKAPRCLSSLDFKLSDSGGQIQSLVREQKSGKPCTAVKKIFECLEIAMGSRGWRSNRTHPPFSPLLLPNAPMRFFTLLPLGAVRVLPSFSLGRRFSCKLISWMLSHGAFSQGRNNARLLLAGMEFRSSP